MKIEKNKITFKNNSWHTDYSILSAKEYAGMVLIIFDYMEFPKQAVAKNLQAFTSKGEKLWIAENPTTLTADAYVNFHNTEDEIWVGNFAGYKCKIEPKTGKIIESIFTK